MAMRVEVGARVRAQSGVTLLALCGSAMALIFLFFTANYPLHAYYTTLIPEGQQTTPLFSMLGHNIVFLDKGAYVAVIVGLHLFYFAAAVTTLRRAWAADWRSDRVAHHLLLGLSLAFAIILFWSYPLFSQDIFDYLFQTREWTAYGANPFTHTPDQFSYDQLYKYIAWTKMPSTYGPLWMMLTAPLSFVAGSNLLANLVLFKGLMVAAYLGTVVLLYATLGKVQPRYQLAGTLIFAWNPLVLFEFAGSGHNDIVMLFFVMLAVWLLVNRRFSLSLLALTAASLIKIVPVFVLPFFLVYIWKEVLQREKRKEEGGAVTGLHLPILGLHIPQYALQSTIYNLKSTIPAAVFAVLCYLPLWEGPQSLAFLRLGDKLGAPIPTALIYMLEGAGLPRPTATSLIKMLGWAGFGVFYLRQLWLLWRDSSHTPAETLPFRWLIERVERLLARNRPGRQLLCTWETTQADAGFEGEDRFRRLCRASFTVLLFFTFLTSLYYQPWYVSWAFVWLPFLLHPRYKLHTWPLLAFCFAAVIGYVFKGITGWGN